MKIARFSRRGRTRYGVVKGDEITETRGSPLRGRLQMTEQTHRLSDVRFQPVTTPVQIFGGVGVNYRDHAVQAEETTDSKIAEMGIQPFHKSNASLAGCGWPIILTPEAAEVHYEGELVIVMGRKARHVSRENASDYILGYTCGNDVSEKGGWEKDFSFWRCKGLPSWGPVGPWIATDVDPHGLDVTVRLNGRVEHRFNTRSMIHDVATIVSHISEYATLFPGDLIFTGTSGTTRALKPGDLVEVEISGIGILENPVVMEE